MYMEWECFAQCQHMFNVSLTEVNIVSFEMEKKSERETDFPTITNKDSLMSKFISCFTNVGKTIPEQLWVKTVIS